MKNNIAGAAKWAIIALYLSSGNALAVSEAATPDVNSLKGIPNPDNARPPSPFAGESCPNTSVSCYLQDNMLAEESDGLGPSGVLPNYESGLLGYRSDFSGVNYGAADVAPFNVLTAGIGAAVTRGKPGTDRNRYWDFLGVKIAIDQNLNTAQTTSRVANQRFGNGFYGALALNSDSGNIKTVWLPYSNRPVLPFDGGAVSGLVRGSASIHDKPLEAFATTPDDVQTASPVPAPAAAWIMLTGVMALLGAARRKPASS